MTGLLINNKKQLNLGKETFNLDLTKDLTINEIDRYSSSFIADWADPKVKDLFEISDLKDRDNSVSFVANIHQRKTHDNAEHGFHLNAFTSADIVHLYLSQYFAALFADFVLVEFFIRCKKAVRTLRPSFNLLINKEYENQIIVEFSLEDESFHGELKFERNAFTKSEFITAIDQPQDNSFLIKSIHLNKDTLISCVDFTCSCRTQFGFGLGPGLILAIASQLVIIQLYAMSKVKVKKNGAVLVACEIIKRNDFLSPGNLIVRSELQNIRLSKKFPEYTIADVICNFSDEKIIVKLTVLFDPF